MKVTLTQYSMMELGHRASKRVAIGKLKANERCLLQRRRTGYTQQQIAEDLGYCRWWVNQMEHGKIDCTPLSNYWDS